MQLRVVFFLLLFMVSGIRSQEVTLLGPQLDYSFMDKTYRPAVGLNLEGMIGRRFSLNYAVLYGPISSDRYYFYTGGGQALGVYLISEAVDKRSGLSLAIPLSILSFVLPESLAYRVPLSNKSQIGIFLAPFGYEIIENKTTDEKDERTSYEMGLRYYLSANNWMYIIPRVGMKGYYGQRLLGASFGVSVMFKVGEK